jgi:hypothetical protein
MTTEFEALNKACRLSKRQYLDEIVIVYKMKDGDYCWGLESEYIGDEKDICERYLNGVLVAT